MRDNKKLTREVLQRVNLLEVIQVISPKKSVSRRGKTRCPLHEDKHPSFLCREYKGIDRWVCFAGCGEGDVIDFLSKSGKASNTSSAITWLVQNNLIDLSEANSDDERNYLVSNIEEFRNQQELFQKFATFVKEGILVDTPEAEKAREYFQTRGIASVETLTSRFKVGFFESARLEGYGFSKKDIRNLGLVGSNNKPIMDSAICFMYQKTFGEYSGFKLRPLGKNKPQFFHNKKDRSKKDKDIGFFGLTCIDSTTIKEYKDSDLLLVEGEFDVLVPQFKALSMYGETFNIVCRSGSAATSINAFQNLKNHGIRSVAIFPDNDEGGVKFIKGASKTASSFGLIVDVIWPSTYDPKTPSDPADICKDLNANEIRDLILKSRVPLSKFLARRAKSSYIRLKNEISDPSNLRIQAISEFTYLANDYGLSDLMRDEYSFELETLIHDRQITAERIRSELEHKTSAGEIITIRGEKYMVTPKGYEKWISTDSTGDGFTKRITNFIIKYHKMIQFPGNEEWEIEGSIRINGRTPSSNFLINSSDLMSPDHFNNLIRKRHPVNIKGLKDIKEVLPDLVSMSNSEVPQFTGVDRIGYVAGTRTYVTPSTIIQDGEFLDNNEFQVARGDATIRQYFENIDFTVEELEAADLHSSSELLLDYFLECLPRRITLMSLGHVYSSVLTPFFPRHMPPHALFLRGLAGSYKSTFAKLCLCLFYKGEVHSQKCLHANHTVNSIQTCMSYVDNAPLVLDDIKAERKGVEDVMLVIQSLYDEQGRSRLNKNYSVLEGRAVRNQGLIITGESIPTSQLSILSRMIQIEFIKSKANTKIFSYLEQYSERLRMLTPHFIKWLQVKYAGKFIEPVALAIPGFKDYHLERAYHQVRKVLTTLHVFFQFLVEKCKLGVARKEQYLIEAEALAVNLFHNNVTETKASMKEVQFIEDITNYLRNGIFSISGSIANSTIIGHMDDNGDVILVSSQLRFALMGRPEYKTRARLVSQILKDLEYQGKCIKIAEGKYKFAKELILPESGEDEIILKESKVDTATYRHSHT